MGSVMVTDTNLPNAEVNKRVSDRVKTFLRAQIVFNNRMTTIDCIVKNISATGARVALNESLAVPAEFEIYIPQRGCTRHARLVWRDKDSMGIDFLDVPQEKPSSAPKVAPEAPNFGDVVRVRELEYENAQLKARIRRLNQKLMDLGQDPNNAI
jgi:hypothetical protein